MIQIVDKEVYSVDVRIITRGMIINHFCQSGHSNDIFLLYDEEDYKGFITWDNVVGDMSRDIEDWMIKDFVMAGKDVLKKASDYYNKLKQQKWLIVLNAQMQPEAFAYNRPQINTWTEPTVDSALTSMEEYPEELDIRVVYPKITTVCLHGCDEWTVRLYYIFKMQDINIILDNKLKWERWLGIKESEKILDCEIPEYEILHIWAEPTETDINIPSLSIAPLLRLARSCSYEYVKTCKKLKGGGRIKIISIPEISKAKTYEQYYCQSRILAGLSVPGRNELDWKIIESVSGIARNKIDIYVEHNKEIYENKTRQKIYGNIVANIIGNGKNVIWVLGPCIVAQNDRDFKEIFSYQLYEKVNMFSKDYEVRTIMVNLEDYVKIKEVFNSIPLQAKDIILFIQIGEAGIPESVLDVDLDLTSLYDSRPDKQFWFWDVPIHTTPVGNKVITEEIFQKVIKPAISKVKSEENYEIWPGRLLTDSAEKEVYEWLQKVKKKSRFPKSASIGAVVVNCNPFTLGHRYLIEMALKRIQYLYIFVVEEDKSFFSFKDRFDMVLEGTSDLQNICVIPSGKFILSVSTFAEYFKKEYIQKQNVDASGDIEIFCRYIAPELDIATRFVGEERNDYVTWQYNRQMEKCLLKYGINFVEIQRKECNGEVISASEVRKCINEDKLEKIKNILLPSTFKRIGEYLSRR